MRLLRLFLVVSGPVALALSPVLAMEKSPLAACAAAVWARAPVDYANDVVGDVLVLPHNLKGADGEGCGSPTD